MIAADWRENGCIVCGKKSFSRKEKTGENGQINDDDIDAKWQTCPGTIMHRLLVTHVTIRK
jgi:hypothetical protein